MRFYKKLGNQIRSDDPEIDLDKLILMEHIRQGKIIVAYSRQGMRSPEFMIVGTASAAPDVIIGKGGKPLKKIAAFDSVINFHDWYKDHAGK